MPNATRPRLIVLTLLIAAAGVGATSSSAFAVVVTREYGIDFVSIGAPGNRAASREEAPRFFPPYWNPSGIEVGRVNYEYRLAQTELTVETYLEFVRAYAPHWAGDPDASALTGAWIFHQGNGIYEAFPGSESLAANMSWYNAARFCNWLHNNKSVDPAAFENGAYDTSTFGPGPGGIYNEQASHHPDARFWLPSIDEYVKGMNFDPDRYGTGKEGYWTYPNSSDSVSKPGYPSEGGQTSAGIPFTGDPERWIPVGAYPDVQSPWGLLDGSGGESEWTEYQGFLNTRVEMGSWAFLEFYQSFDELGFVKVSFAQSPTGGVRLAAAVPAPATISMFVVGSLLRGTRRRP